MEEGSILKEEPQVHTFSRPNVSFTFPEEDGGKSLRTVPGGVRTSGEVHMAAREGLS